MRRSPTAVRRGRDLTPLQRAICGPRSEALPPARGDGAQPAGGPSASLCAHGHRRHRRRRRAARARGRAARLPAPGLEVQWLGVSGYRITYEGVSLFVDPYVSRVPLRALLLGRARDARRGADRPLHLRARPRRGRARRPHPLRPRRSTRPRSRGASRRRPTARRRSRSSCTCTASATLAREVTPHKPYELGPFVVRFVPSRHSKLLFGRKIPMDGELTCDHLHALSPRAYRCGQVWGIRIDVAGMSLYHQGSADLDDDELRDEPVDVFLAGVAGRSFTPRYWERILPRLDPRLRRAHALRRLLRAAGAAAELRAPGAARRRSGRGGGGLGRRARRGARARRRAAV